MGKWHDYYHLIQNHIEFLTCNSTTKEEFQFLSYPGEANSPMASQKEMSLCKFRTVQESWWSDLKYCYFSVSKMWVKEMESSIGISVVICIKTRGL